MGSTTLTKPRPSQLGQPGTHIHMWQIDSHNIGTCKCGEVRQFPWDVGGPVRDGIPENAIVYTLAEAEVLAKKPELTKKMVHQAKKITRVKVVE